MNLEEALKWADDYPDNVTIPLAAEIRRLRAELAECIAALEKIANPIDAMQRELPDGARLNGAMATALANDPSYLKEIAKAALAARKGDAALAAKGEGK